MSDVQGTPTRTIEFVTMAAPNRPVWVKSDYGETGGSVTVPFLTWGREEDRGPGEPTALILDDRFMYVFPEGFGPTDIDTLTEFVANAIAIGAGYASIYFTERRMPFRG